MPTFSEGLRLKIVDIFKGTKINSYYRLFASTLNWNGQKIIEYQTEKLKRLLVHAYRNIPFYSERFAMAKFNPYKFEKIEQLKNIPTLSRDDLRDNQKNLINKGKRNSKVFKSSSSGTTGIPIQYYHDISGESAGIAAGYILYYLSGWRVGRKGLHIWGNPESIKKWKRWPSRFKRLILNQKNLPAPLFNDIGNYPSIVELIKRYKPKFIDGYTNTIYSFAQYLDTNSIQIPRAEVVFTTAENLLDNMREIIERNIGPVSDLYGCGEINGIAIQPVKDDKYYILEPHVLVENESFSVDFNEIIITDLDNYYMPLIRYKTGDIIDRVCEGDENSHIKFKYFKKIKGRTTDIIDLDNGKKILPVNLLGGTFLRKFREIIKHKVIWDGNSLTFMFELYGNIDMNTLRQEIAENLKLYNVNFKIKVVKKLLPDKNGKYKYFEKINI